MVPFAGPQQPSPLSYTCLPLQARLKIISNHHTAQRHVWFPAVGRLPTFSKNNIHLPPSVANTSQHWHCHELTLAEIKELKFGYLAWQCKGNAFAWCNNQHIFVSYPTKDKTTAEFRIPPSTWSEAYLSHRRPDCKCWEEGWWIRLHIDPTEHWLEMFMSIFKDTHGEGRGCWEIRRHQSQHDSWYEGTKKYIHSVFSI